MCCVGKGSWWCATFVALEGWINASCARFQCACNRCLLSELALLAHSFLGSSFISVSSVHSRTFLFVNVLSLVRVCFCVIFFVLRVESCMTTAAQFAHSWGQSKTLPGGPFRCAVRFASLPFGIESYPCVPGALLCACNSSHSFSLVLVVSSSFSLQELAVGVVIDARFYTRLINFALGWAVPSLRSFSVFSIWYQVLFLWPGRIRLRV